MRRMKVIQRDVRIMKTVKVTGMGLSDLYISILVDMVD